MNTYTTGNQVNSSVASDASGNFVVVWQSYQDGGSGFAGQYGIFGQRYDSGGNRLGSEFQVNTYTTNRQEYASVSSDASGNFVVVWESCCQYRDSFGVFGQRYDSSGNPLGGEFQVDTGFVGRNPAVSSDASGNFVVVWDTTRDLGYSAILAQRYDSEGSRQGEQFQVNSSGNLNVGPSVASNATGSFVVAWNNSDCNDEYCRVLRIVGQLYDSAGNRLGEEFEIAEGFGIPSVAYKSAEQFAVVWEYRRVTLDIFGQRYDNEGNPLGGEFQVNTYTTGEQGNPSIASDAGGNFVVVWQDPEFGPDGQDGSEAGVFGRRYDSDGNVLGGEFQVNTYTRYSQKVPAVSSDASGNFVVVWESEEQDGSSHGIFGQRFAAGCEASLQVEGDVHTPGSTVAVQVHIAHHRPKTATVPWEMSLLDATGQVIAKHTTAPHTFEPGDVVDKAVEFRLPDDLAAGTYTLELGISGMAGTKGATTTLRVVRAE